MRLLRLSTYRVLQLNAEGTRFYVMEFQISNIMCVTSDWTSFGRSRAPQRSLSHAHALAQSVEHHDAAGHGDVTRGRALRT